MIKIEFDLSVMIFFLLNLDICNVLNGGCSDICVLEKKSYRCECDNGF